jgi:hypothetical protein
MFQRIVTNIYEAIINARMLSWLFTSLILTGFVYYVAPHQLETTVYKLSLITTAAWLGYWIDRSLFPYARPDHLYESSINVRDMNQAALRRAIIISACIIGAALGA